jgi:hypothetical protein
MNLGNTVLDIKDTNGDTYHISDTFELIIAVTLCSGVNSSYPTPFNHFSWNFLRQELNEDLQ